MKWLLCLIACALGCFITASALAAEEEMKEGLVAEFYSMDGAVEDFPTIPADKKPTVKRVDKQINVDSTGDNWPGTDLKDHYYIRWTGSIKIAKDGKFKFFTESDDGSRLFIDGKEVVSNGGLHGMEEKEGEVELKAGAHDLKVEFFQNEGEAGCKMSWQAPGGTKEIVPASALSHKKSAE
ncbi:MAG: PA14 domain-containing protein [Tepidisphaerales bacterium]